MHSVSRDKAQKLRRLFHMNMVIGVLATVVAVALIITGEYANLTARQAAEAVLNRVAVGGLLYIVVFWLIDTFSKPFLVTADNQVKR